MDRRETERARTMFVPLGLAFLAVVASCAVPDQLCPSNWVVGDSNECPYGPPGGPQKQKQSHLCPLVVVDKTNCAGVTFEKLFSGDPMNMATAGPIFGKMGSANCTSVGCHGTQADAEKAKGLYFPDTISADAFYTQLAMYKNPQGDAYWGMEDMTAWAECNLLAEPGGGSPMPKPGGLVSTTDQNRITQWVTCGMEPPGSSSSTSSSSSSSSSSTGAGG